MFKVKFFDGEQSCLFAELKSDVEACQLALALHQSSTIDHVVSVENGDQRVVYLISAK